MSKIHLILPMSISINDYYFQRNGMKFPCPEVTQYMHNVQDILKGEGVEQFPDDAYLKLTCTFCFNHNISKTDVDNFQMLLNQ